jgi:hypothetical protein
MLGSPQQRPRGQDPGVRALGLLQQSRKIER